MAWQIAALAAAGVAQGLMQKRASDKQAANMRMQAQRLRENAEKNAGLVFEQGQRAEGSHKVTQARGGADLSAMGSIGELDQIMDDTEDEMDRIRSEAEFDTSQIDLSAEALKKKGRRAPIIGGLTGGLSGAASYYKKD